MAAPEVFDTALSPAAVQAIRHRMRELDMDQRTLAERIGVDQSMVSKVLSRKRGLRLSRLRRVADVLQIPEAELLGVSTAAPGLAGTDRAGARSNVLGRLEDLRPQGGRLLPVYRWGSCGDPRDRESGPDPDLLDYAPLGREALIGPNGFGLIVRGESMANRDIHDGDVVWVNPDQPVRVGRPVLARLWDAEGYEVGMVVKVLRSELGSALWGDGEGEDGRAPVVGSRYELIGPVVLVSPAPHPPR